MSQPSFPFVLAVILFSGKKPAGQDDTGEVQSPAEVQQSEGHEAPHFRSLIQPADLPEETKRIMDALVPEKAHVFELIRDESPSARVNVWVEVFEKGQKQDDVLVFTTGRSAGKEGGSEKSHVVFSMDFNQDEEKNQRTLYISAAIADHTGISRTETEVALPGHSVSRLTSSLISKRELQLHRPVTLLTVIEDDGNGLVSDWEEVDKYDETGTVPDHFLGYDRILLFRFMLENDPYSG